MKKAIVSFVLSLTFPLVLFADGYTSLWKQYNEAETKDLPKTQIKILNKIIAQAKAGKSYGNLLKAEFDKVATASGISDELFQSELSALKKAAGEASAVDPALAAVYNCALGCSYSLVAKSYYKSDSKKLSREYFDKALADPEMLASKKALDYAPFVREGVDSEIFGNDLLSLVGYYSERYALLNDYYNKAGNRRASLVTALWMLEKRVKANPVKKVIRGNTYLASLDSLVALYGDLKECGEVAIAKYDYMADCQDVTPKQKVDYIMFAKQKWAAWKGINRLERYYAEMVRPGFEMNVGNTYLPNHEDTLSIEARNLKHLTVSLYRLDTKSYLDDRTNNFNIDKAKKLIIAKSKVVIDLPVVYENEYDINKLYAKLPKLQPGMYYVVVEADNKKLKPINAVFTVSDVFVGSLPLPGDKVRYAIMSATTGQPLAGAKLQLWRDNKVISTLTADEKGEVVTNSQEPYYDCVRAYTDTDNYMIGEREWNRFNYYGDKIHRSVVSLFTDRSIYRPGQTVHVSAVAYKQEGLHSSKVTTGAELKFTLSDANNKVLAEKKATTDDYGTASVDFNLPGSNVLSGRFSVRCMGNGTGYAAFRVEEYKRPTFDVKFDEVTDEYHDGDTLVVGGTAMTFSGVPVPGVKVAYDVQRRCSSWFRYYYGANNDAQQMLTDTVMTDSKGRFEVRIPVVLPADYQADYEGYDVKTPGRFVWQTRYRFTATATVTDNGGESHSAETSIVLGSRATELKFDLPDKMIKDSVATVVFNRYNASAKQIDGKVTYWFDSQTKKYTAKANENIKIDWRKTSGILSGRHQLWATCGNDTVMREFVLFGIDDKRPAADTPDWAYISSKEFPRDGKPVYVQVGTSCDNTLVRYSIISSDKELESGTFSLSNAVKTISLTYKEEYGEAVLLNYLWVKDGKAYSNKFTITRPLEDKRLDLKWVTFRDRLTPGQKEKWTLNISRPKVNDVINKRNASTDGQNNGQLLALMYDKSLEQIVKTSFNFSLNLLQNSPYTRWRMLPEITENGLSSWQTMPVMNGKSFDFNTLDNSVSILSWMLMLNDRSDDRVSLPRRVMGSAKNSVSIRGEAVEETANVLKAKEEKAEILDFAPLGNDASDRGSAGVENADGEERASAAVPQIRENLNETAFFYPALYADKDGNVDIEFTLPESVTTWNFRGFAHDKEMNFGMIESEAVASKKVMVMPNVPRFVREGDKATMAARVANATDKPVAALVRMQLLDPETERVVCEKKQNVTIDANATANVDFSFDAQGDTPLLVCRITAEGKGFSDGEQHYLPVLPSRESVINTVPFTFTGSGEKTVAMTDLFPKGVEDKKLTVEYTANPSWLMIQTLPYISTVDYKNAITLSTAYYANALGRYIMNQSPVIKQVVNIWKQEPADSDNSLMSALQRNQELKTLVLDETPWVMDADNEADQKRMLTTFFDESAMDYRLASQLKDLKDLQNSDGSWSWWRGMRGSASITAQVLQTLARLNVMAGYQKATAKMIENGMDYLRTVVMKEFEEMKRMEKKGQKPMICDYHAIQYLYINTLLGKNPFYDSDYVELKNYLLKYLEADRHRDIYSKALMAVVLNGDGKAKKAKEYVESIRQYTVTKPGMGTYFDTWHAGYSWFNYRIPTQTAAIEALKAVDPADTETINLMRLWLLQSKRTQAWDTPINTVNAVYAFLDGNYKELSSDKEESMTLAIDGKNKSLPKASAGLGYTKVVYDIDKQNSLTLTKTGEGTSWGAAYAQFTQAAADIADSKSGIKVVRQVMVPEKGKAAKGGALNVGDRIAVRITITADRDYDFVQIVDKRAACMEPVAQTSGYGWGYYCTPKDNATHYYFDRLSKGEHVVETEYYIDRAGNYTAGTCTVQCAYSPEFSGRAGGMELKVVK